MKAELVEECLPRFTAHVVTDMSGRDPLGLSRTSFRLTELLMPGIVVNTDRARYYALYTWILWHIAASENPRSPRAVTAAFQRREAAIAYATLLGDPDSSPAGKRSARRRLDQAGEGEVSTEVAILPSNPLGGYGQYYQGSIYNLGLTRRDADGIDRVTDGFATHLAQAVDQTLAPSPYVKGRHFEDDSVPVNVLRASADRLRLDAIRERHAADERALLRDAFFEWRADDPELSFRRLSLARILHIVDRYEAARVPVSHDLLDDQLVYGPTYHGVLVDEALRPRAYEPPQWLVQCNDMWRQFCLHEYLTWALELLLGATLDLLGSSGPTAPADVVAGLTDPRFDAALEALVKHPVKTPRDLLAVLGCPHAPDASSAGRARRSLDLAHAVNEESVLAFDAVGAPQSAATAVAMLGILFSKWRGSDDTALRSVQAAAGVELSAPTVLPVLDGWMARDVTWQGAIHALLSLVVHHHDRIMYEKGRLDSCWLHLEGDRLVRDQDYAPGFRASRHEQAVSILRDLLLLELDGDRVRLTAAGRGALRRAEDAV